MTHRCFQRTQVPIKQVRILKNEVNLGQDLLHHEVFPGIEAKKMSGYQSIELFRRNLDEEVEFVTVRFDVSRGGATENIIVMDSTNECFEKAAVKSIEGWRYSPETGQTATRKGLEQTIHFQME